MRFLILAALFSLAVPALAETPAASTEITAPAAAIAPHWSGTSWWNLWLLGYQPADDSLDSDTSDTWLGFGFSYHTPSSRSGDNTQWRWDLGWLSGDGEGVEPRHNVMYFLGGEVWGMGQQKAQGGSYFGLQGGIYRLDPGGNSNEETAWGGRAFWGYNWGQNASFELGYHFTADTDFFNEDLSGLYLGLGWKFGGDGE